MPTGTGDLQEAAEAFDRAFAEGRLEDFIALFAEDARLLIHQQEEVVGADAIRGAFAEVFEAFDTSAYEPRYEVVDHHGDRGYVLLSFREVLRPRDGSPAIRIRGRTVEFWRRDADGRWRVTVALTSRSAPDEPGA